MKYSTKRQWQGLAFLVCLGVMAVGCTPARHHASRDLLLDSDVSYADLGTEYNEQEQMERRSLSPSERFSYDYRTPAMARFRGNDIELSRTVLNKARSAIGTPYVSGGSSLSGFDCSGFVRWTYNHVGISLPRTAREQSRVGQPVPEDAMVAGDIVTFRHPRRGYHTGIYIGDGKFIHSPRKRKNVQIASLDDPYFSSTFVGARRVTPSDTVDEEAAERLLAMYGVDKRQSDARPVQSVTSRKDSRKVSAQAASRTSRKQQASASRTSSRKQQAAASQTSASRKQQAASSRTVAQKKEPAAQQKRQQTEKKNASARQSAPEKKQPSAQQRNSSEKKQSAAQQSRQPEKKQPASRQTTQRPAPQKKQEAAPAQKKQEARPAAQQKKQTPSTGRAASKQQEKKPAQK